MDNNDPLGEPKTSSGGTSAFKPEHQEEKTEELLQS